MYGFVAGDDGLKTIAMILTDVLNERGDADDFLGQVGGPDFVFTTSPERVQAIAEAAVMRFDRDIPLLYSYQDRKAGYMIMQEGGSNAPGAADDPLDRRDHQRARPVHRHPRAERGRHRGPAARPPGGRQFGLYRAVSRVAVTARLRIAQYATTFR